MPQGLLFSSLGTTSDRKYDPQAAVRATYDRPMENWRKSTKCESSGCVEVAEGHDVTGNPVIKVRDTRGWTVEYTPAEWDVFLRGVKAGEFDQALP